MVLKRRHELPLFLCQRIVGPEVMGEILAVAVVNPTRPPHLRIMAISTSHAPHFYLVVNLVRVLRTPPQVTGERFAIRLRRAG